MFYYFWDSRLSFLHSQRRCVCVCATFLIVLCELHTLSQGLVEGKAKKLVVVVGEATVIKAKFEGPCDVVVCWVVWFPQSFLHTILSGVEAVVVVPYRLEWKWGESLARK